MSKYYSADYTNTKIISHLDDLSDFLLNSSNRIQSYTEKAKTQLEGKALNIILNRLNMYSTLFKYLSEKATSLSAEINSSNKAVSGAMEGKSVVSSDELRKLEIEMNNALSRLNSLDPSAKDYEAYKMMYASQYYAAKARYDNYKVILEATTAADSKGVSGLEAANTNISKIIGEIGYQSNIFN